MYFGWSFNSGQSSADAITGAAGIAAAATAGAAKIAAAATGTAGIAAAAAGAVAGVAAVAELFRPLLFQSSPLSSTSSLPHFRKGTQQNPLCKLFFKSVGKNVRPDAR